VIHLANTVIQGTVGLVKGLIKLGVKRLVECLVVGGEGEVEWEGVGVWGRARLRPLTSRRKKVNWETLALDGGSGFVLDNVLDDSLSVTVTRSLLVLRCMGFTFVDFELLFVYFVTDFEGLADGADDAHGLDLFRRLEDVATKHTSGESVVVIAVLVSRGV
jgi:hypothetical protein